jgi:ribosomal protein S18 acetylase RimI-like enzyme
MDQLSITTVHDAAEANRYTPSLQNLLQRCVNDEPLASSIGFLAPLTEAVATAYWRDLFPQVLGRDASTILMVLTDGSASDEVIGTVQVATIPKQTHAHRGEIRKLLIHPDHRGRGLGRRLMESAERASRDTLKLDILVLDTATETAALEFYRRTGWTEWGTCPDYACFADGRKGSATFFYKQLAAS